jgi:peptidoglycan/LPS O-acetylase OafA/YrhL
MASIQYRPEIDGLRAVAVVPVILFHLNLGFLAGGYLGVDVFFVISGYLITGIVIREVASSSFSLKNFWARRARRILPALLATVIITQIASGFLLFRPDLYDVGKDAFATIFSYANIHMWLKFGDYWGAASETSPFLHAWSLSVEEQFYIFYPLLLLAAFKFNLNRIALLSAILMGSLLLFAYGIKNHPEATFYLLPTRAWELACGGLIGLLHHRERPRISEAARKLFTYGGIVLILIAYTVSVGSTALSYTTIFAVAGAGLLIYAINRRDWLYVLLASRPFVYVGKISYSAYLVHWPIIALLNEGLRLERNPVAFVAAAILLTIVATLLLHYLVERPSRHSTAIFPITATLYTFTIVCSGVLILGLSRQKYPDNYEAVQFYGLYYDASPTISTGNRGTLMKRDGIFAPERPKEFAGLYATTGIRGTLQAQPHVVVIGDSHGAMWAKTLDEIATELDTPVSFFTTVGSYPLFSLPLKEDLDPTSRFTPEQRLAFAQAVTENIKAERTRMIIVSLRWATRDDRSFNDLRQLVDFAVDAGKTVLLVEQVPEIDIGDHNSAQYLAFAARNDLLPIRLQNAQAIESMNRKLREIAESRRSVTTVSLTDHFLDASGNPVIEADGAINYYDDDHLSYQGTSRAKAALAEQFKLALGDQ